MNPLLSVRGLTIEVRHQGEIRTVIEEASFDIARGEALALVGESGSGKSLIAMGAIDLLPPTARVADGEVDFDGRRLTDMEEAEWGHTVGTGIGVVLQNPGAGFDPLDRLGRQTGEALALHSELSAEEIEKRVLDAFGWARLPRRRAWGAYSHELSGGQAQRAMLAAALIMQPRLLVADEPISHLDVTTGRAVLQLMDDLRSMREMSLLFVTHDLGVVAAIADRVAVVYGGRIVEMGSTVDIFSNPSHPYTSGLLGATPGLRQGRLRPIAGESPSLFDLPRGCSFAPRCPFVLDVCLGARPPLKLVRTHPVACYRADQLTLPGISG